VRFRKESAADARHQEEARKANQWIAAGTFFRSAVNEPFLGHPWERVFRALAQLEQRIADLEAERA